MKLTKVTTQAFNNKRNVKSITIKFTSWLTPNEVEVYKHHYNKTILKLSKRIRQNLYFKLLPTNVDVNKTIVIVESASKLIQPDKESFIEIDVTIYNKLPYQNLKHQDNQKTIQTVINEVENSMKKETLFNFNHKKKPIPIEV